MQLTFSFLEPPTEAQARWQRSYLEDQLGFRVTKDRKRIVIRRPGSRRQATAEEIALWCAFKDERVKRKKAQQRATDLDCAILWIENLRETRRHATETLGRTAQVTKLAEKAIDELRAVTRLLDRKHNKLKSKARHVASALQAALSEHIMAAENARRELGIDSITDDRRFRGSRPSSYLQAAV